jgi:hypothetical protein
MPEWSKSVGMFVQATQYHPEGKPYAEELMEHYSWYAEDRAKSTSAKDFRGDTR